MKETAGRWSGQALSKAMFGAGLVKGGVQAVVRRASGLLGGDNDDQSTRPVSTARPTTAPPAAPTPPATPREVPVPTPPTPATSALDDGPGITTPVGTTGAAPAFNPSTAEADLQQPGTEQIMEPSTVKAAKKEAETMRRAAERNPD